MASHLPSLGLSPNHKMSESDIHNYKLPYGIGVKWKDLARALGYFEPRIDAIEEEKCHCAKECCIKILVLWMNREGDEATAARLADALRSIGLKNLADILIYPIDPSQINAFEKEIREMKSQLINLEAKGSIMSARIKELEEENLQLRATVEFKDRGEEREQEISQEQVSRMGNKSEELKEQLLTASQKCQEKEEEILRLRKEIDELKEELSNVKRESDDTRQEEGAFFSDAEQAGREHRIGDQLKNINKQLNTYVTFPLQAPVVKQDQLRFSVRLNLLIRLSENLQELYTETQGMISEAAKCSEDLRRNYYDLAYHGLRAEHFDLVHKVEDLESAQEEMSEEERKDYDRLQTYQKDRQRQVEALDKVWRRLFSPVDRLPKTAASDPTGNKSRGYKKLQPEPLAKAPVSQPFAASEKPRDSAKKLSRHSDPGARPKQLKPGGDFASAEGPPPSKDEGVDEVCLNFTQQKSAIGSLKSIFKKKDSDEKQCSVVSYIPRRDS